MSREIVLNTAHHFNWVNLGGAVKHPDKGKIFDLSSEVDKLVNISDSSVKVYPSDGYGNSDMFFRLIFLEFQRTTKSYFSSKNFSFHTSNSKSFIIG